MADSSDPDRTETRQAGRSDYAGPPRWVKASWLIALVIVVLVVVILIVGGHGPGRHFSGLDSRPVAQATG